jgi:hypothetical protein
MLEPEICSECKVPGPFNQQQDWLNNGDIVQRANHAARIALIDCENLDPLFANIGDILGLSIEHLIMNIAGRANRRYLEGLIPPQVKEMIQNKQLDTAIMIESIATLAQVSGYGKYEWLEHRYENDADDYAKERVTDPHSLPLAAGGFGGAVSAGVGGEHAVSYEEISPGVYIFTARRTEYPTVLKEKLQITQYEHGDGDIGLERCATCGGPKALADYQWNFDKGLIVHKHTGRRLAMLGPAMMDPIFKALEGELGETIPKVVVEAQRRFVKTGFYPMDILESEDDFRDQLALKGLGNLKSLKMDGKGLRMRLDNACLHLLTTGLAQGAFELAFGVDSSAEWELSKEGDLELTVAPK